MAYPHWKHTHQSLRAIASTPPWKKNKHKGLIYQHAFFPTVQCKLSLYFRR